MLQEVFITCFIISLTTSVSCTSHSTRSLSSKFELPVEESQHSLSEPRIAIKPVTETTARNNQAIFAESLNPFSLHQGLKNVTRETGTSVVFKCEFRGDVPITVEWFCNEALIDVVKGKREILPSKVSNSKVISRLKLSNLDVHDTGFYKCLASHNGFEVFSEAILKVSPGSTYISSQPLPDFNPEIDPEFPGSFSAK